MKNPFGGLLLETFPGLCGEIARYVDSRLSESSPHISIPAALSFLSAIKAGRTTCRGGVSPSLYVCVISPTGSGKTQAGTALEDLIVEAELEDLVMGEPGSDAGMISSLEGASRKFLIWDEFGAALTELSKNPAMHKATLLATITKLWSASGKIWRGKQYAAKERIDIKEPYLSIYGGSTPNRFFEALNTNMIQDGVITRWFLAFAPDNYEAEPSSFSTNGIVGHLKEINTGKPALVGNLKKVLDVEKTILAPNPYQTIQKTLFRNNKRAAKTPLARAFWSRAYEQFMKVCIILSDGDEIANETNRFAGQFVEDIIRYTIFQCERSSFDSPQEKAYVKLRSLLQMGQEMSLSEITAKSRDLKSYERNALIDDLIQGEFWEEESRHALEHGEGKRKKPTTFFRCVKL